MSFFSEIKNKLSRTKQSGEAVNQSVENQAVENQTAENQTAENQTAENQAVENQAAENQAPAPKSFEQDENITPGVVQSYEDYSDVNDDIMNIFDENTDEEQEHLKESFEKFSEITEDNIEVKSKLKALDSVGKDIDQELMALLQADEKASDLLDSAEEINVDFVNKVTVFDTVERQKAIENQEIFIQVDDPGEQIVPILFDEPAEPSKNMMPLIFYGVCGALVLAIVIATAVLVVSLNPAKPSAESVASKQTAKPLQVSNNANYIYINYVSQLNGEDIVLQKMVMDSLATVFYFDKKFSVQDYNITLVDDAGKMYGMDLSFYPFNGITDSQRTILYFKPFDKKTKQFTLSIHDRSTDSKAEYTFDVDASAMPAAKYVLSDEDFLTDFDDVTGIVQSAQFSTTGSTINFSFNWDNKGESIIFGDSSINVKDTDDNSSVTLKQASMILPTKSKPNLYVFESENSLIGRMDFEPLKNLTGNVRVTFKNLMKKYEINQEITVEDLLFNKEDSNVIINIGDYDVCLDRLIYEGSKFVLVLHAVDRRLPAGNADDGTDNSNRVEVVLDAKLIIVGYGGVEIPLDGTVFAMQEGSDIVYNAANAQRFIDGMDVNNFKIDIKSAAIKIGDVTASLDLSEADTKKTNEAMVIEKNLISAFESRLAYKSGEIPLSAIEGFSGTVMDDTTLLKNYTPVLDSGEKIYSAQIVTYALNKENQVIAVMQESWRNTVEDEDIYFYRTHKVVCNFDGSGLMIISDTIQN